MPMFRLIHLLAHSFIHSLIRYLNHKLVHVRNHHSLSPLLSESQLILYLYILDAYFPQVISAQVTKAGVVTQR